MELKKIDKDFTVCKVQDLSKVKLDREYVFISKTDEEISVVCETDDVPENTTDRSDGFKALRIEGKLDFSLIGILSKISTALAKNNIGLFAISTYNTDYILVKKEEFDKAVAVLDEKGYRISE
ncbi:ACT domain-containing protein [Butyrivibrio sp. AC2005]|uniref:ACT domain-containing protein n=1 Tax=Butyrivibrio sp. AC2005 TaxID=1280672 RepID=UPI00041A7CBD|nr:ACT domain-containing protein [Butyrivibrio sp. AC2005]